MRRVKAATARPLYSEMLTDASAAGDCRVQGRDQCAVRATPWRLNSFVILSFHESGKLAAFRTFNVGDVGSISGKICDVCPIFRLPNGHQGRGTGL
jgi:hypothetical protein